MTGLNIAALESPFLNSYDIQTVFLMTKLPGGKELYVKISNILLYYGLNVIPVPLIPTIWWVGLLPVT